MDNCTVFKMIVGNCSVYLYSLVCFFFTISSIEAMLCNISQIHLPNCIFALPQITMVSL